MTDTSTVECEDDIDHHNELPRNHPHSTLDSHRTLWMGDLQPQWDAQFILAAFKELGHVPSTVKMVTDRQTGVVSSYSFPHLIALIASWGVEFNYGSRNYADAMLRANGHKIANSEPRSRFNLSFANDPRVPSIEVCNSLSSSIFLPTTFTRILTMLLSTRCSALDTVPVVEQKCTVIAMEHQDALVFIRFGDQTEQQMALVEMNKTVVRGREIILKLAAAKQRLPRHQIRDGMQPQLIADPSIATYNQMAAYQQPQQQPQVAYTYTQPQATVVAQPSELVYPYNPTAEEANAELIANGDAWWEELEESR
ncbi:hypothetical protein OSTOST_11212 [Ostertagia ostertagi]